MSDSLVYHFLVSTSQVTPKSKSGTSLCSTKSMCSKQSSSEVSSESSKNPFHVFTRLSLKKKPRFSRSSEDYVPLPDPFSLPTHYRDDVERCLNAKVMTQRAKTSFFSAVAASMLTYKKYPLPKDFSCVYRSIVAKYPFLEGEAGSQEVSNVLCLAI